MRLTFTEEQRLLEASAQDFLAAEYPDAARRASLAHADGCRPAVWQQFADLGWLALPLPEAAGGLGGSEVDLGLLMQALGRHRVVEPYLACAVLAGRLLSDLRVEAGDSLLADIVSGHRRVALAHAELGEPDPYAAPRCRAERGAEGWLLRGFKPLVAGAPGASALLVSACDEAGRTGLFQVDASAPGLRMRSCGLTGGGRAADVHLDAVPAARLGDNALDARPLLRKALARALVAGCWQAQGLMRAALEETLAYTTQRVQFGRPLAQFQVVQHRLAEMQVCCEEVHAACLLASLRLDLPRTAEAEALCLAAMAKSKVGRSARHVAQEAVQLHGAMGVCEELPIAATFRALTAFGQQGGSTAWHASLLGRLQLAGDGWRRSQTLIEATGTAAAAAMEARA